MPRLSYRRPGLVLRRRGRRASRRQIRDLQRDLRRLGYLRRGIDGVFGARTERAVEALQHELLWNDGRSTSNDGEAPVRLLDYNRGRVVEVTGRVDQALAGCLSDILDDSAFPQLPSAEDPVAENQQVVADIAARRSTKVPIPFVLAVLKQESNLRHYHQPRQGDEDTYIVVGLDRNASRPYRITSRGYGLGQYTLFHHPPRADEVQEFMLDPVRNLEKAIQVLRDKFDHFVNGPTTGTRADDRVAEYGRGRLRLCKYTAEDERYLRDCVQCLRDAGSTKIRAGVTPLYPGSRHTFRPTRVYRRASYRGVPIRAKVGCDWPYAVRRYNGLGLNSYHYQVRVLKQLLRLKRLFPSIGKNSAVS